MVYGDEHDPSESLDTRDVPAPLEGDRQFVLVSTEVRGSASPSASERLPPPDADPPPPTCLEAVSDACVVPVGRTSTPVADDALAPRRRRGDDGPCGDTSAYTRVPVAVPDWMARDASGFADGVLRPVTRSAETRLGSGDDRWASYREANERVATAVADLAGDDAVVWTVGPHFAPLGRRLRAPLSDEAFLFHYWPVHWPPWEPFRAGPRAAALVESLLGNDLLGFEAPRHRDDFLRTAETLVSGTVVDRGSSHIEYDGSPTAVRAVPKGIAADRVGTLAVSHTADGAVGRFRDAHGIAERRPLVVLLGGGDGRAGRYRCLRALERRWSDVPSERGRFTVVHCDRASAETASRPRTEPDHVVRTVERSTERFGTDEWRPVVTRTERLSDGERYALYRDAAVGVAASIRGTAIPEAQEFVAAQSADPGVLLVSTETRTANRLGRETLTFSPFERLSFVRQLDEGLRMRPERRGNLMADLTRRVRAYDDETWLRYVAGTIQGVERRGTEDASV